MDEQRNDRDHRDDELALSGAFASVDRCVVACAGFAGQLRYAYKGEVAMGRAKCALGVLSTALMLAAPTVSFGAITVTAWSLQTNLAGQLSVVDVPFSGLPLSTSRSDATSGSSATTTYSFADSGGTKTFDIGYTHAWGLNGHGGSAESFSKITFTASEPFNYSISGNYAHETGGSIYFDVGIEQGSLPTPGAFVRESFQRSNNGIDTPIVGQNLIVGETAGNMSNILNGPMSGQLAAGTYTLFQRANIYVSGSFSDDHAQGSVTFVLSPVPEPSLVGVSAVLGGLLMFRRTRQAHAS